MNKAYDEGLSLVSEVVNMVKDEVMNDALVILAPPFIHLHSVKALIRNEKQFKLAAQNCHHEKWGAYTGEISAEMLASAGCEYVILGHSERRTYFGENDKLIADKIDVALSAGLIPIFCCGESLDERNAGKHFEVLEKQLSDAAFHLSKADFQKMVIAYEPVWAIGTGITATPGQAQEMHSFIRNEIEEKYGKDTADSTTILYGGSCNAQNARPLFSQPDIDGGLIGGASLKSREFTEIVKSF